MEKYTIEELKKTGTDIFRSVPTNEWTQSRNGRRVRVTKGTVFVRTKNGEMPEEEWYGAVTEAVAAEGKTDLLERIKKHCLHLAFLHGEKEVTNYALECLVSGAYNHWKDMRESVERFERLKRELFNWGPEYIEEFLGYEYDRSLSKDAIDNLLDGARNDMDRERLEEFYEKFLIG